MKKLMTTILAGAMILSLAACGSNKPSIEEVEQAIEDGTVTVTDALDKGLVDQAWVDAYEAELEASSVAAADKTTANMIGEFETQTLGGETFTNENLSAVTYFAFINPNTDAGMDAYNVINETYDAVIEAGGDVLIVCTDDDTAALFADSKFPVVEYNDSMIAALGSLAEMVNLDGFSGSSNGNGSFLTAWYMAIDSDGLISGISSALAIVG